MKNNDKDQSEEPEYAALLTDRAYKMLARREYSAHELRQRFRQQAPEQICELVIENLIAENAQSDHRFAEMLCRSRYNAGKGPVKLIHELNSHYIDPIIIEQAMAPYDGLWKDLANQVRIRKFGEKPPVDFKEWARQARFLQGRGFSSDQIEQFDG